MTETLPDNGREIPKSANSRIDLQSRVTQAADLRALLDLLGTEIERLNLVDGYMISVRDAASEHLVFLKVHLTQEFHVLEETYYRYKVALAGDALNLNARAFHSRGIVQFNTTTATDVERNVLNLWKLEELAAIAILDDDNFGQPPIGTVLLLKQHGRIDERIFDEIENLISVFYKPLWNALEKSFVQENPEKVQSSSIEQSTFLQFVVEITNSTSSDTIFQTFATDMFRQFAFDGLGFFLLDGGLLVNKRVETADPHYQDISSAWEKYLREHPYELNLTDGAISHTFLKNTPLMFHDVQEIFNLPMSDKDRGSLTVLKTIRTLLLVPICLEQSPIGVLAFYSLLEPVNIDKSDLELIGNLAGHFGTAIANLSKAGAPKIQD